MWVFLAVLSAIGLGFYDICKKRALTTMSVLSVLFGSVVCSSLLMSPMYILSRVCPQWLDGTLLYVPHVSALELLLITIKAALVLSSWVCAYYAMRRLPITVVTPINATRPMWTLMGAVLIFHETLNSYQWSGVGVAIVSFFAFSYVSIHNRRNEQSAVNDASWWPYVALMGAVLLGAASGLYDKHLMRHIDHNAVLVYYTWIQALMMGLVFVLSRQRIQQIVCKEWVAIAGISVCLTLADFVYLLSLSDPNSLIAVVSLIRRSSVLITFCYGALVLKEKNILDKGICLVGIAVAMVFLLMGSI